MLTFSFAIFFPSSFFLPSSPYNPYYLIYFYYPNNYILENI
nr:MAG TPA: hypothetical protein [Caudoviricetes sp.]